AQHLLCAAPEVTMNKTLLALSLLAGCNAPLPEGESQQAIDNGALTATGSWFEFSTVGVQRTLGGGHVGYCTGTIIAPRFVLTASHCFPDHMPVGIWFYTN